MIKTGATSQTVVVPIRARNYLKYFSYEKQTKVLSFIYEYINIPKFIKVYLRF